MLVLQIDQKEVVCLCINLLLTYFPHGVAFQDCLNPQNEMCSANRLLDLCISCINCSFAFVIFV